MNKNEKFRKFFEENYEWISTHSLLDTDNLKTFYEMYYEYISLNNLLDDKGINVFRIVIKQEIVKSLNIDNEINRNINNSSFIDNPRIRKWYLGSMNLNTTNNYKTKQKRKDFNSYKHYLGNKY